MQSRAFTPEYLTTKGHGRMARRRANGEGTLRSRRMKNGRTSWGWAITVWDGTGRRRQLSRWGFDTRAEAQTALRDALRKRDEGKVTANTRAKLTVGQAVEAWLAHLREQGVMKRTTLGTHEAAWKRLRPYVGHAVALSLTQAQMESVWKAMQTEHNWGATTRGHSWRTMRAALTWAFRDSRMLHANPCHHLRAPKMLPGDRPKRRVDDVMWDRAQLDAFTAHCTRAGEDQRTRQLGWALAVVTGMRRGELAGLRWPHVCLDGCDERSMPHVHVVETRLRTDDGDVVDSTKTEKSARTITLLAEDHTAWLRTWKREQTEQRIAALTWHGSDYVLTYSPHHRSPAVRSRPVRPDALTSGVKQACSAAGVPPVHLHGLRHVHASQLIAAGMPITEVSARLGHADTAITLSIYGHAMRSDSTDDRAAAMWAAAR
jgi:integrase